MTKVFQVLECGGPGGTGNQVAAICSGLDSERFETWLLYAVRPGSSPSDYERSARGARRYLHVPQMRREISPLSDLRAWWRLWRIFRRERPDVVHAHSSKAGVLARTAAWAARVPRIYYSPHGYAFLQADRSAASRALYRWIERAVSRIGEVVAVSSSEAELAKTAVRAHRVRVIEDAYLGEDPDAPAPKQASDRPLVGALGRLTAARRPEAFLRLAESLRGRARFVWIGSGELEAEVRRRVRESVLEGAFELTGWLAQQDALRRLRACDVLVHYSRWDGLANAVIEAMVHGLPVVASDIPGNRDAVEDGKTGFLVKDEAALTARVSELLADPALRARLGAAGREAALKRFSRERMIEQLSSLYLER